MAVPVQIPAKASTANGATSVFPYDFLILDEGDLLVTGTLAGVTTAYVLDVDYTVSGVGVPGGGNVTFISGNPANGTVVLRKRNMAFKRDVDYQANGDLIASEVNGDIDRVEMQVQQLGEGIGRAITLPPHLVGFAGQLPEPEAGRPLVWNTAENSIVNGDTELSGDLLLRGELASTGAGKGGLLVRFIAAGVGAVARWLTDRMRETYHLTDYADDAAALAAGTESMLIAWDRFQAVAPAEGCTVVLPSGVLSLPATLVIGNQPAGTLPSTVNGIKIKGQGTGRTAVTMLANRAATRIRWDGAAGGTMVLFGGPLSGCSLEDVMLDANDLADTVIESRRSFHQTVRRVLGVAWTGVGIKVHATSALVGYGGAAPIGHVWDQVELQNPSGADACGVDIGQGNGNLNQLNFRRCYFDRSNNIDTWSARFGYCDHLVFEATHFAQTGALGSTGKAIVVQPQTGLTNFPQNIMLLGCSFAGGVHHDTSVGGAWSEGPTPALIAEPWATADGAPVPPASADGGPLLPGWMLRGHTDNGLAIGWAGEAQQAIAATPTIAPLYSVIILDDDAGTAANNLIANITPPRSVFSVPLGGYRLTIIPAISGTHPVKLVTGGNIAQEVTLRNYQAVELVFSEGTGFWSVLDAGAAGTYTPTVTNIANTSALTAREFHWSRSGNTVEFAGRIEFTATAGADTASQIEFSLPIAPAAFGASWELAGTGVVTETVYRPAALIASGSAGRVLWQSAAASAKAVIIKGSYQVA